jgi:hypothetical protein
MANRVKKRVSQSSSRRKATEHAQLLTNIFSHKPINMPSKCSYCDRRGLVCQISPSDSSRCASCVQAKRSDCDVQGLSAEQLQKIANRHMQLEKEFEAAMEEEERAKEKTRRLWKQKKLWHDKMLRAIARGIEDLDELDRLEREEAMQESERNDEQQESANDAVVGVSGSGAQSLDWEALGLGSPSQWEVDPVLLALVGQDSAGGTGQSSEGPSSNVP